MIFVAMVDEIGKAQAKLGENIDREPDKNFSDYQSEAFQHAKVTGTVGVVTLLLGSMNSDRLSLPHRWLPSMLETCSPHLLTRCRPSVEDSPQPMSTSLTLHEVLQQLSRVQRWVCCYAPPPSNQINCVL